MYIWQDHGKLSVAWFAVVAEALSPADGGVPNQGDGDALRLGVSLGARLGARLGVQLGVRQGLGPELDPGRQRGGEADKGLEYLHLQHWFQSFWDV